MNAADLLFVKDWGPGQVGLRRVDALQASLAKLSPQCQVSVGTLTVSEDRRLAQGDGPWDLAIGAVPGDDLLVLEALSRSAHAAQLVSLTGHLDGMDAIVGPAVIPGQTACWNCTRLRLLANSDHPSDAHALHQALLSARPAARARTYLAPMAGLLGNLLALEAVRIITRFTPSRLVGRLVVQNLDSLETTSHAVVRMPWCDVCGGAGGPSSPGPVGGVVIASVESEGEASPPQTLSELKTPEELRRRLAGWVDERTGVVRYLVLGDAHATDPDLPVTATAVLSSYTEGSFRQMEAELGSGKALTSIQAMVGAVGEAIERYSAARYRGQDLLRCAYADLPGEGLDPRMLCLYEDQQYLDASFPFDRFDPNQPIEWTRGHWLDNGEDVWLPALPTFYNYSALPGERFCQVTSNGLAAGTDLEDASRRALFELVERDAFMVTWLTKRPGQRLTLDDHFDIGIHEVVRQLQEHGAELELYRLDAVLVIPVIACLGLGDGSSWPAATVSLAADAVPRIAAQKAILEQGHVGPYIRRLMRDGKHAIPAQPQDVRSLLDHALFYTDPDRISILDTFRFGGEPARSLDDLPVPEDTSLAACSQQVTKGGVRIAIADVTSPDVATSPFRVARALGTFVQPIDFGQKLRRLANPRLQAQLTSGPNPYPHPIA